MPGTAYTIHVYDERNCDFCWLEQHNGRKNEIANEKKANSKISPKLKAVRRALTKAERKQRKAEVEALFNDPKALEHQQRLLKEALERRNQGGDHEIERRLWAFFVSIVEV